MPITLTVSNLKGGAGKTTTVAHAACALHDQGRRVIAFDADPQGSLFTWHELAGFPFPCVQLPSARLHKDLPGIVEGRYDVAVVDTPGTEHGRAITLSALRVATHALIPCAPHPIEVARLADMRALIEDATDLRPSGAPPVLGVLLVKAPSSSPGTTASNREVLQAAGWPVLRPVVANLIRFSQSYGEPVEDATQTGYGDAVAELLQREAP